MKTGSPPRLEALKSGIGARTSLPRPGTAAGRTGASRSKNLSINASAIGLGTVGAETRASDSNGACTASCSASSNSGAPAGEVCGAPTACSASHRAKGDNPLIAATSRSEETWGSVSVWRMANSGAAGAAGGTSATTEGAIALVGDTGATLCSAGETVSWRSSAGAETTGFGPCNFAESARARRMAS